MTDTCPHCIAAMKCCEKYHADQSCCGEGIPVFIKCPDHVYLGLSPESMSVVIGVDFGGKDRTTILNPNLKKEAL